MYTYIDSVCIYIYIYIDSVVVCTPTMPCIQHNNAILLDYILNLELNYNLWADLDYDDDIDVEIAKTIIASE